MPTVWFSLKKSLHCKSEPGEVHDPKSRKHLGTILTRKGGGSGGGGRSGCSRSISNLKDVVIHGSKRHMEKPPNCSPRSIGSSEFLNPITHEVILSNSRCELRITGFSSAIQDGLNHISCTGGVGAGVCHGSLTNGGGGDSTFVGTLRPGTPGPGGQHTMHYFNPSFRQTPSRKSPLVLSEKEGFGGGGGRHSSSRISLDADCNMSSTIICHKCGEQFSKLEAAENHHLSKHAGKAKNVMFVCDRN